MFNFSENDSNYLLLKQIRRGSKVLEFGCANGNMTRIMSELLNCEVSIVEYDKEAFDEAMQYAKDGLCGDISTFEWVDKFNDKFDYIMFADVLEHLRNPEEVLVKSKDLLAENGRILVSIPNIAHNDIIANLFRDDFNYKSVGLLDNTHIHFFTGKSFEEFCSKNNFIVVKRDYTLFPFGKTEQGRNDIPIFLRKELESRQYGEVYQLIYTLGKDDSDLSLANTEDEKTVKILKELGVESPKVYLDFGEGFSEKNVLRPVVGHEAGHVSFSVNVPNGIKKIRIDPCEFPCNLEIKNLAGIKAGSSAPLEFATNGEKRTASDFHFKTTDPIIEITTDISCYECMTFVYKLDSLNDSDWKTVVEKDDFLEGLEKEIIHKDNELLKKDNELICNNIIIAKKNDEIAEKDTALENITQELFEKNNEFKQKESEFQTTLALRNDEIALKNNELAAKDEYVAKLRKEISLLKGSRSWRFTKPLRSLGAFARRVKIIKWPIKFLLSLKRVGIRETLKKVNRKLKKAPSIVVVAGDYLAYDSVYQENKDFSGRKTDVKVLTYYLPQFHTFKENDEWWGKGFTEWTNTEKAEPHFEGHYQPRRPHNDIGFYDLSDINVMKHQAELAKSHGIYGFCFYYYWFSGKRLLEKPVDQLLSHPEIEIPFCLCWANENWTRTWSGNQKDVLMAQKYSDRDIDLFVDDIKKYIDDKRYIRVNGKPVIIVYNSGEIPNIKTTFAGWRKRARENGIGDILIWTCRTCNNTAEKLGIIDSVDAEVEFPPHNTWGFEETYIRDFDLHGKSANIYNYQRLVDCIRKAIPTEKCQKPVYRAAMLGWDNACRRMNGWTTYYAYSLKSFYKWVSTLVTDARKKFGKDERFVFINAWNEWAEGTYLEPDEKYGYANINTFSKAVFDLPFENRITLSGKTSKNHINALEKRPQIAVQAHIFYLETAEEIARNLSMIPYPYDCYITTDTKKKKQQLEQIFLGQSKASNIFVSVVKNQGRDVAPFLCQMQKVHKKYKYICHIHSKKTGTSDYGDFWREYLYKHLFGSAENLEAIFNLFENNDEIGLIYPDTYPLLKHQEEWGGNKPGVKSLLGELGIEANLNHDIEFPVGNMFWMRTDAVKKIWNHKWNQSDFPKEEGQVNLTIAHQIERSWNIIAESEGYKVLHIFNDTSLSKDVGSKKRLAIYAHYSSENKITADDVAYVKALHSIAEKIVVVSNNEDLQNLKDLDGLAEIMTRPNKGYDFGAWKYAVKKIGYGKLSRYDEVVFANNSCYAPIFGFEGIFGEMNGKADMWGMTEFPYIENGSFIGKDCIKRHIQSYFFVFNNKILQNDAFRQWWDSVGEYDVMEDVVANCEGEMTNFFESHGFTCIPYLKDSSLACKYMNCYSIAFEHPYEMFLLGNPFIKKKSDYSVYAEEKNVCLQIRKNGGL